MGTFPRHFPVNDLTISETDERAELRAEERRLLRQGRILPPGKARRLVDLLRRSYPQPAIAAAPPPNAA